MYFILSREDAEPSPRPTHKVAVHIPSQQNFDSDSDIEEVRESGRRFPSFIERFSFVSVSVEI